MQLKLISLNLAGFKDWQSRQQRIVEYIANENPDVLLLQEVMFDPMQSAYSQSALLNKQLQVPFPFTQTTVSKFYQSSGGTTYREGLAVLSRFPITNSEVLVLTRQADDKHPRIVQNIDVHVGERSVLVSNIHLSNNKYSVEQLEEFLSILKSRGEKRIIAGDFNIFDLGKHKNLYQDEYTASAEVKKYVSFPSENATLDYMLLPKEFTFESLHTHEGVSDHAALAVAINIKR